MAWRKGMFRESENDRGAYMPTPEEIAEAAAAVRRGWNPSTFRQRAGLSYQRPGCPADESTVEIPVIAVRDLWRGGRVES